jgi:hypothetical protein
MNRGATGRFICLLKKALTFEALTADSGFGEPVPDTPLESSAKKPSSTTSFSHPSQRLAENQNTPGHQFA